MTSPSTQPSPSSPTEIPPAAPLDPQPDRALSWKGWLALGLCVLAANAALLHEYVLRGPMPATVAGPRFEDRFERAAIGDDYFTTGGHWRIARGELWAPETKNNPLWLKMRLPRDVAIAFTARSETASGDRAGDIKFEVFGNGRDHASGYVCIFGGWGNTISVVARLDEHGKDRQERRDRKVEAGRTYRMRVERQGTVLRWYVDGVLFLAYDDPRPLAGEGHDRFGFSSWAADLFFDDLTIEPL